MKDNSQFKTMRHIEAVRNYIGVVILELLNRQATHDQTKLQTPEVEIFNEFTPKLRGITYGSDEYRMTMTEMLPAIRHHNSNNRHHPEHFENRVSGMNLIDIIEMLCDWKAATMRHGDGDIYKSLEINRKRFEYSGELHSILKNTIDWLEQQEVFHHAEES